MTDINDAAMKAVWQSQTTEVPAMPISYVRHRARELQRAFRLRNLLEQGGCILGLVGCVAIIVVTPHPWIKAGMALLLIGVAYSMMQWRRRAAASGADASESIAAGLAFYKRELERKRDIHRTLWRWYLLPIAPGTLAIVTWSFFGDLRTKGTWSPWVVLAMLILWIALSMVYERFKAAQCQREIDALSALENPKGAL